MARNVSQLLARFLTDRGVRYIFGVSGHSVFDLTDAVYQEPDLDFVPTQIELSAAYMADAYARAGRRVGVCLGSSGAGVTNLVTGVTQAFKESSPVIVLGADVDRAHAGKGASSWHEVPQAQIFQPITKMSVTLKSAEDILDVLPEAYRLATSGRKGPVYIGIPRDLQVETVEADGIRWRDEAPAAPPIDEAAIKRAAAALAAAERPTIIAGGGVYWAGAEEEVQALAELLGAPFGVPHSQKGMISEAHPLALGCLGFGSFPFANDVCCDSDVILAVGTTFSEGLTLGYGHRVVPEDANIIHIDLDPTEIGKIYPVDQAIVGDAKEVLRALLSKLRGSGFVAEASPRLDKLAETKRAWRADWVRRGTPADGAITGTQLFNSLQRVLPADTLIVGSGGTGDLLSGFQAPCRIYQSGDFRAIGHGLSSAVGIAHAFPERRVVCVTGDGGFMMELQELATVARCGFPLTIVVDHNDAYGNMKRDQIRHYGGRVIGTDLLIPDLVTLASSFGLGGERVERSADLDATLGRAFAANKPVVVDVVCPIEGI